MSQYHKPDQSFDSIANKFQSNIYGTSKGRLRHELLVHYLDSYLTDSSLNILEAGGGSGEMALALLRRGHHVHLTDISADMLNLAQQQCGECKHFSSEQIALQDLEPAEQYELVICHAVLEWLQDPLSVLPLLVQQVKPGGLLSLSFFNRDAHLFGNALYGNFDYIDRDFTVTNRVRLNPNKAVVPKDVINELQKLPASIIHQAGIRCFHDYMRERSMQQSHYQQLKSLELKYGNQHPYMWLGKYFHIIVRKEC